MVGNNLRLDRRRKSKVEKYEISLIFSRCPWMLSCLVVFLRLGDSFECGNINITRRDKKIKSTKMEDILVY